MTTYQTLLELRREERTRQRTSIKSFVEAVVDGDVNALSRSVSLVDINFVWKPTLRAIIRRAIAGSEELRLHFLDTYVAHGDHIRREVGDDLLLADALRLLLPTYQGPGLRLFRGESLFNRRRRSYGLSWTNEMEVAQSFAETGMCRTAIGGSILLGVDAAADAIICAPAIHNDRFGKREFIVDRRRLKGISVIARYQQMSDKELRASRRPDCS
jgi:hypothetical protein